MRPLLTLLLLLLLTGPAAGQEHITDNVLAFSDSTHHPGVGLEAFDFLVGYWEGEGLGGHVEEFWTPASGGSMNGLFRLVHGDELALSEHMAVDTLDGRPIMRVKHFSSDFEAWEDKAESVAFPLIRAEPGAVYMGGLTIKADGTDALVYYLIMGSSDGSQHEEVLRYRRVR
jgi:hypothetical protein